MCRVAGRGAQALRLVGATSQAAGYVANDAAVAASFRNASTAATVLAVRDPVSHIWGRADRAVTCKAK